MNEKVNLDRFDGIEPSSPNFRKTKPDSPGFRNIDSENDRNIKTEMSEQMKEKKGMLVNNNQNDNVMISSLREVDEHQVNLHQISNVVSNIHSKVKQIHQNVNSCENTTKKTPDLVNDVAGNNQIANACNLVSEVAESKIKKKPKFEIVIIVRNLRLGLFTFL